MKKILLSLFSVFFMNTALALTISPDTLVKEGMAHVRDGAYAQGIEKLEAARMLRPRNVRVLYQLGLAYYNGGMATDRVDYIDRSQQLWREAIALIPPESDSLLKSTLEDITKRADDRRAEVEERHQLKAALSSDNLAIEEGLAYAKVLHRKGERDAAAELYQKLADTHTKDPRPYTELATMVYHMGRILWAERYYDQALQRAPSHVPARKGLSELYESLEALRVEGYEKLIELSH